MSLNPIASARTRAKKAAATLLAALMLALSLPHLALAQAASEPAATAPAAAPATLPAPPSMEPAVAKETVDNPYGLQALWKQGDFVARGTLIIMVIMSHGQLVHHLHQAVRAAQADEERERGRRRVSGSAGSVKAGVGSLEEGSAFRYIAESGIKASEHHEGTLVEQIDKHTWVVDERAARDGQHQEPAAGRHGLPGHRRIDRAVRRPVRHRLGHLSTR